MRRRTQHANRIAELLRMADRAHSHAWSPQQMSSGEQQRTGIAVALANHHELVLADDPSASSTPQPPRRSSQPWALPTKISTPRSSWSPTTCRPRWQIPTSLRLHGGSRHPPRSPARTGVDHLAEKLTVPLAVRKRREPRDDAVEAITSPPRA
ncbi:ATP-binding cassette domain-containing protein [Streptomyces sp. NPDC001816]|uniref:ATP-binding cassette domain-containing protein n=1 Tax=Streptomyces sp. NPDC001816 TaxID=3364612 RepID=UPI00368C3278